MIHNIGDVCDQLLFINNGLARAYILDENGKDYTWSIFFNDENSHMTNLFVVDYDSFINQSESKLSIEALADCELVGMHHSDLMLLYDKQKKSEHLGRILSQEAYSYIHNIIIDKQTKSAKERFDEFMNNTPPYLLDKIPQYHVATFLGGITPPQHLSRLKKKNTLINICE